jgi:hypothetical protein
MEPPAISRGSTVITAEYLHLSVWFEWWWGQKSLNPLWAVITAVWIRKSHFSKAPPYGRMTLLTPQIMPCINPIMLCGAVIIPKSPLRFKKSVYIISGLIG